jgi:hypothetical protein
LRRLLRGREIADHQVAACALGFVKCRVRPVQQLFDRFSLVKNRNAGRAGDLQARRNRICSARMRFG